MGSNDKLLQAMIDNEVKKGTWDKEDEIEDIEHPAIREIIKAHIIFLDIMKKFSSPAFLFMGNDVDSNDKEDTATKKGEE